MKKTLLSLTLIGLFSTQAHAGFWDSLFGGSDDAEKETTQTQDAATNALTDTLKKAATDAAIQKASEALAPQTQPTTETPSTLSTVADTAKGLLPLLTNQLNVTETQAEGGLGSLLQLAQSNLSTNEFSELGKSIPNMDTILAAAPLITGGDNQLGGLLSKAGSLGNTVSGVTKLYSQFDQLGLSGDMIMPFVNIIMGYFNGENQGTADLLQKGLGVLTNQS